MTWKDRYRRKPIGYTSNKEPVYADTYYIIETAITHVPVHDGFVVKINKVSPVGGRVWFNDKIQNGNAYTWKGVYDRYIVREATPEEIKKHKEYHNAV